MKRSEINAFIGDALLFFEDRMAYLPPFCHWTPEEWTEAGSEADEIRENALGWDITDFGFGNFAEFGLLLVTTRNGNQKNPAKYPKPYAEKFMIVRENQKTPMHFHHYKMEDIINRGGGELIIKLYNSTKDGNLDNTDVRVTVDGVAHTFPAGFELRLAPGQSITLPQYLYHSFWGERGTVLVAEVSMCNDDDTDNRFLENIGRFPVIEEDEAPLRLLCKEYPAAKS